jgi:SAM-dependent methyltransferase
MPISNEFLVDTKSFPYEKYYELKVLVCNNCGFVQLSTDLDPLELFKPDYVYFSSYSKSWLAHAEAFAKHAVKEFDLSEDSVVVEVASNDGYLLQYFKDLGVKVLGIEPTQETAEAAVANHGIETIQDFFTSDLALEMRESGRSASLLIGNNVLAHVPNIHDFIRAVSILLAKKGRATFEFPHLVNLIMKNQFDTIYHEHYSYLSLTALSPIFQRYGLSIYKVEKLPTHGGSIRIYVAQSDDCPQNCESVIEILNLEDKWDPRKALVREEFQARVNGIRDGLISEIGLLTDSGVSIIAYGAAAKGNTLLNLCGITSDMIQFVVDSNPNKQEKFLPGSHIPVIALENLESDPGVFLILPWNIQEEIVSLLHLKYPESRYLVAIPEVQYVVI